MKRTLLALTIAFSASFFVTSSASFAQQLHSNLYSVSAPGWLAKRAQDDDVFTCIKCQEQVQIQVSVGPPLSSEAPVRTNQAFIAQFKEQSARNEFARLLMKKAAPFPLPKNALTIKGSEIGSLGGLRVLKVTSTMSLGPQVMHDVSYVALHKSRFVKISIGHYGILTKNAGKKISSWVSSFRFL